MADYIYTMETRLSPEQQRAVVQVQEVARTQGMNLYLTGGAIRDIISGFSIRDVDFTVEGNPLKLQKDLERRGTLIEGVDDDLKRLYLLMPGNVRAEISMARTATYDGVIKRPIEPSGYPRSAMATDRWAGVRSERSWRVAAAGSSSRNIVRSSGAI